MRQFPQLVVADKYNIATWPTFLLACFLSHLYIVSPAASIMAMPTNLALSLSLSLSLYLIIPGFSSCFVTSSMTLAQDGTHALLSVTILGS
jgi:hypothetical protein